MKEVINELGQVTHIWESKEEQMQLRYKAMKLINQYLKDAGIKTPEDHRYDRYKPI